MEDSPTGPKGILTGTLLAPILVGVAYALGRNLTGGWLDGSFYLQSPLTLSFFSGLIVAFACRPVLLRISWSRGMALGLGLALLLGQGPVADWCLARLIEVLGLGPFPYIFPRNVLPDVLAALAAAGMMAVVFRPRGGGLPLAGLKARLKLRGAGAWAGRLAALAVLAVGMWLVSGWLEALWSGTHPNSFTPVIAPNLWIQNTGGGFEPGAAVANGTADPGALTALARGVALLALHALRALALFLPLMPIALAVRGSWLQISAVFSLLLFIVGDFAPLIMDQPYPSTRWLLARTALGVVEALLLGSVAARLIGRIRGADDDSL